MVWSIMANSINGDNLEGYGMKVLDKTKFINASNLDGDYQCVNDPFVVEI